MATCRDRDSILSRGFTASPGTNIEYNQIVLDSGVLSNTWAVVGKDPDSETPITAYAYCFDNQFATGD